MNSTTALTQTADGIESLIEKWHLRLASLEAENVCVKPGSDRWSISEVVGHLVDSACNNHQRFVRAQFSGELVFPKYDQNEWATAANYLSADWDSLVQLWYHYNRMIASLIRNINPETWRRPARSLPTKRALSSSS
jgi:hypothetical protein